MLNPHNQSPTSRRDFLLRSGGGFGALALTLPARAGCEGTGR